MKDMDVFPLRSVAAGRLVFKAHTLLCHSSLGSRVIKKKTKRLQVGGGLLNVPRETRTVSFERGTPAVFKFRNLIERER